MSGTSMDGLDIAYCHFTESAGGWSFVTINAITIPYSTAWSARLVLAKDMNAIDFHTTDIQYGALLGSLVNDFVLKYKLDVDFVASHGHTLFHQPKKNITCQIGDGAALAAACGLPVVCDFRSVDVALGGQGAPLVPIGDRLLFSNYTHCLNLGGIANISFEEKQLRRAFDICPVNMILNYLAQQEGLEYDTGGKIAMTGQVDMELLGNLNKLNFYQQAPPKSLGREWFEEVFLPIIAQSGILVKDAMRTAVEHIAMQIGKSTAGLNDAKHKVLITGGGAFNSFLVTRIQAHCKAQVIIPAADIVSFKEALIFGFLGVLRMRNEPNCLQSVTGASRDNCGGAVYQP